jgi:DNA-binding LytR/AlgR family response regulator
VPYRNILYVDIDWQHKLCLHMANRDISVSLPYEGTAALLLEDPRFLECHHRILVNMDMIASMGKEDFVLKNGAKVPISHRKAKEAKQAYMHYMAHK